MRRWSRFGAACGVVASLLIGAAPVASGSPDQQPRAAALAVATVTVRADPTSSTFNDEVRFTATVTGSHGTPTGQLDIDVPVDDCNAQDLDSHGSAFCYSSYLPAGHNTVTVEYDGDDTYAPATGSIEFTVAKGDPDIDLDADPEGYVDQGAHVTFTAALGANTADAYDGQMTFSSDGAVIPGCRRRRVSGYGEATCTPSYLPAGRQTISATYLGDSDFRRTTVRLDYLVRTPTLTRLAATPGTRATDGRLVTLRADVSAAPLVRAGGNRRATTAGALRLPSGTVAFTSRGRAIHGCTKIKVRSGSATCRTHSLAAGLDRLHAAYSGNRGYIASSSSLRYRIVAASTNGQPSLADTGAPSRALFVLALLLIGLGATLTGAGRRRRSS